MPATPDDFHEFQVVDTRDESVVGIEDGDLVFLSTESAIDARRSIAQETRSQLPYD